MTERTTIACPILHNLQLLKIALVFSVVFVVHHRTFAQQLVLPVTTGGEAALAIAVDQLKLISYDHEVLGLDMQFCLVGKLPQGQRVTLTPRLSDGSQTVDFPAVTVYGRWAFYSSVRGHADSTASLCYRDNEVTAFRPYMQTVERQPWMNRATLTFLVSCHDGCGSLLGSDERTALQPRQVLHRRQDEGWRDVKSQKLSGTAYVVFPVAQTEVLPDHGNNREELWRLCHVVDSLRQQRDVRITRIAIKGFASPEGTWAANDRLARERTASLASYLADHCGLASALISTTHVAEDWEGLRRHVAQSRMAERADLLAIIDSDLDPDARLAQLAQRYPEVYRRLSLEVFPLLRHTDYTIDYTRNTVTEHQGRQYVDTLLALDAETLSEGAPPSLRRTIRSYRPLLAVKTNMLYDLAVAPNIELELPLGHDARWSLMAEYGNPWWRWDRKSQSYQVQEGGLELRRWLAPRCSGSRPTLCGHLLALYGAAARYDLENKDVGDQGEVLSAGLTYGYAWPLGRHWNIEASVSAGAVWGKRRHYNAEFESTHLIYKYTKNLFYAGPTKLKLSLVWLLGKEKGGAR